MISGRPWFAMAMLTALAVALLLRLPDLGVRPMHGDEVVHAFKFAELWEKGVYRYDPNEYHGPTLYYAALPVVWLSGHHRFADMQEADLRRAVALLGAAMVLLLLLLADGLGRRAAAAAALLLAVSPAFVFYSRYFIQEVPLAFFTLAALACAWRYRQSGRLAWLAGAAVSAGLMIATKETAVLAFAAAGAAWLAVGRRQKAGGRRQGVSSLFAASCLLPSAFCLLTLGVAYLFLSGFLSNPAGPLGYLRTYALWGRRGAGETLHAHPWYYYLSILLWNHRAHEPVWSEALIVVLAVAGGAAALARRAAEGQSGRVGEWANESADPQLPFSHSPTLPLRPDPGFLRFLAVYTLALGALYCGIPYKTPWLVLSFLSGLILLAGAGAAAILDALRSRPAQVLASCLLLGAGAQLGWQAWAASFVFPTSAGNPYAYAQPSPDVVELGKQVEKLARAAPEQDALVVKVIAADPYYWPLPWYLRRMRNVGYWTEMPPDPDAPVAIIASTYDPDETLNPRLPHSLMTGYYGLRPGAIFELWVHLDVWQRYLSGRKR
jgi:uncharacterized protein (TIGR03663 family)